VDSLARIADTYVAEAFPNFDKVANEYYSRFTPEELLTEERFVGKHATPEVVRASPFLKYRGGEQALLDIVSFWRAKLDENADSATDREQANSALIDALVNLGDWYVRFRKPRYALRAFGDARQLMTQEAATKEFAEPKLLFMPKIDFIASCFSGECIDASDIPPEQLADGEVQFLVKISANGNVQHVTKLKSTPADFVFFLHKQETRRARYRPAIVDDKFMHGTEVPVVHKFHYRISAP